MWKDEEVSALVEYIALYYSRDENSFNVWPAGKNDELWGKCADAVNCYNIGNKRSGKEIWIKSNNKHIYSTCSYYDLSIINLKYTRQYFIVYY